MKITIVTPSFNQSRFIEKTLLSIWQQKGDFDLEHIVIDAGSNDGSLEILQRYEKLYREQEFHFKCRSFSFHWKSEPDEGQSHALNKGFSLSTGDIIGWLNSDDTFVDDECLDAVHDAFLSSEADLVVGNFYCIDEDGKRLDCPSEINKLDNDSFQKKLHILPEHDLITQPSCLFTRRVWEKYGIDQSYHYAMDWKLWINAYNDGCRFYKITKFIANNRLHSDTKTFSDNPDRFREILRIFREFDTYCPNRVFFAFYYRLLEISEIGWLQPLIHPLILTGKLLRRRLIRLFKTY
ncbi:MAG: glycosyltransferase family 2 protein [Desulfurivibrionaceae bacterium]